MSVIDELLENNRAYAEGFGAADLPSPPAKKVAVVTCMDARIDPAKVLGFEVGDAHVLRNAGGVVTDEEIRSLAVSQHLLGTEAIVVIGHTDCGMAKFTDEEFATRLESATGERPAWRARTFVDVDEAVRESLRRIRKSPFVPNKSSVRGFVYDVETGLLREVE